MEKVLIDTDVIIDFLRGHKVRIKDVFDKIQKYELKGLISLISIVELYAGKDIKEKEKLIILNRLLSFFEIITPDLTVAKIAGGLKQEYSLSLADAIIAAQALEENTKIFTFNIKHYQKIPKLSFYTY